MTDQSINVERVLPLVKEQFLNEEKCTNEKKVSKGEYRWSSDFEWTQHYSGSFLQNNLHGDGTYNWFTIPEGTDTVQGNFYANNLEGYGRMSYSDKKIFEGLYRMNRPFGPGVLNYENGTQDVGFWYSKSLVRLSCALYSDWVPKLGKTAVGKAKLLGYRSIICLGKPQHDVAKDILERLGAKKEVLLQSDELYAPFIRNPNSKFFNKPLYDEWFYGDQEFTIEVAKTSEEISLLFKQARGSGQSDSTDNTYSTTSPSNIDSITTNSFTKQVKINELLAWNNGELSVEMLKHTFLNRKTEKSMPFKLYKLVLGDRAGFESPGEQESACIQFLRSCSDGDHELVAELFRIYSLNPDVCDANGNSGIIFAAARDRVQIIKALSHYDANIDFFNDEGLTALTISLCRYLSLLYNVTDWEKGFLRDLHYQDATNESLCYIYPTKGITQSELIENLDYHANSNLTLEDNVHWPSSQVMVGFEPKQSASLVVSEPVSTASKSLNNCNDCPSLMISDIEHLKLELSVPKVYLSFAKIVSVFKEFSSAGVKFAKDFNDKIEKEMQERLITEKAEKEFSEFQEPYVYIPPTDVTQKYVFVQEYVIPPKLPKKKKDTGKKKNKNKKDEMRKKSTKSSKSSAKKKKGKESKETEAPAEVKVEEKPVEPVETEEMILQRVAQQKLEVVVKTILALLAAGADVNLADVPMSTVLLATFTKNARIFRAILEHCENPNASTAEEDLTPFHVLATFPPSADIVEMCDELAAHKVDANIRANPNHWAQQKEHILAKQHLLDAGKTPLQLLCMREDYRLCDENLEKLCRSLLLAGSNPNSLYLGHTALTLALIRGNVRIMETLLQSGLADPNQILELNMGTPMTVLLLKRYKNVLALEESQAVCELLAKYHGNPLNSTGELGNAIEFDIAEYTEPVKGKKDGKKGKGKKGKTKKSDKSSSNLGNKKGSKKGKDKKKQTTQDVLREFLIAWGRSAIQKHSEGTVVKYLYDAVTFNLHRREEHPKHVAKLFTPKKVCEILQMLIKENVIREPNSKVCFKLLKLIDEYGAGDDGVRQDKTLYLKDMVNNLDFVAHPSAAHSKYLVDPIVDADEEKYVVCFQCLTKKEKRLIACPRCEQVYLCSPECDKALNARKPSQHRCAGLFYKSEKQAQDMREWIGEPKVFSAMADVRNKIQMCVERREKRLQELVEYEAKLKLGLVPRPKFKSAAETMAVTVGSRSQRERRRCKTSLSDEGCGMYVRNERIKGYRKSGKLGGSGSSSSDEGATGVVGKVRRGKKIRGSSSERDENAKQTGRRKDKHIYDDSDSADVEAEGMRTAKHKYKFKIGDGSSGKERGEIFCSRGGNTENASPEGKFAEGGKKQDYSGSEAEHMTGKGKPKSRKEKYREDSDKDSVIGDGNGKFETSRSGKKTDYDVGESKLVPSRGQQKNRKNVFGIRSKDTTDSDEEKIDRKRDQKLAKSRRARNIDENGNGIEHQDRVKTFSSDKNKHVKCRRAHESQNTRASDTSDTETDYILSLGKKYKINYKIDGNETAGRIRAKYKTPTASNESEDHVTGRKKYGEKAETAGKARKKTMTHSSESEDDVGMGESKKTFAGAKGRSKMRKVLHNGSDVDVWHGKKKDKTKSSKSDAEYGTTEAELKKKYASTKYEKKPGKDRDAERLEDDVRALRIRENMFTLATSGYKWNPKGKRQIKRKGGDAGETNARNVKGSERKEKPSYADRNEDERGVSGSPESNRARNDKSLKKNTAKDQALDRDRGTIKQETQQPLKSNKRQKRAETRKEVGAAFVANRETRLETAEPPPHPPPPPPLDGKTQKTILCQSTKRLPLRFQYFMQQFAAYFENFDWLNFMLPYAVFYNDQLYYKFFANDDIYLDTFSNV